MLIAQPSDFARLIAFVALFVCARPALGQTLNGGQESFVWAADCLTDQTLNNSTELPIAGLWIAIDAIGVNNAPELGTITVHDTMGMLTWDVDDDEDQDNDDAGENDAIDSTPNGPAPSNGWHRVQARGNADVLSAGRPARFFG